MSDQVAAAIADLAAAVRALEKRVEQIAARPVHDAKSLRSMGIPQHEAYRILRAHGVRANGRGKWLISDADLKAALRETRAEA